MIEITITNIRELYSRLAYLELDFQLDKNGKTITFECPIDYQEAESNVGVFSKCYFELGYYYWGVYARFSYNLADYQSVEAIIYDAFQFWKESYKKNLESKIDAFKRSIL